MKFEAALLEEGDSPPADPASAPRMFSSSLPPPPNPKYASLKKVPSSATQRPKKMISVSSINNNNNININNNNKKVFI